MRYAVASVGGKLRRGIVAPTVGVCLVLLLAMVALAIDGGMLLNDRRKLQAAADAAALAAAIDLYSATAYSGLDSTGSAAKSAKKTATDNGFTNGTNNVVVTVNIPPASGDYSGHSGYAEVIITMQQQRYFSTVIGSGNIPVTARAVAVGGAGGKGNAIIILNPSGNNMLQTSAGGSINASGANIVVDSTSVSGMSLSSTGNIQADNIYVNGPFPSPNPGGYSSHSGLVILNSSTKVQTGYAADPLKTLAAPTQPSTDYGGVQIHASDFAIAGNKTSNGQTYGSVSADKSTMTLNPGYYSGGLTINDNVSTHTYVLSSGVYYFGQNLNISSFAGTLTDNGQGVCLYMASGGITYSANSGSTPSVTLSAISSGTYSGYPVIYQNHGSPYGSNTDSSNFMLSGGANWNINGIIYLPFANSCTLSHTGSINVTGQMIANALQLSSTGNFNVTYSGPTSFMPGALYLVE